MRRNNSIRPQQGVRNYAKGGDVEEESKNPWESKSVFESWENDPGIQGHADPRSKKVLGRRTGDENVYPEPPEKPDEDKT